MKYEHRSFPSFWCAKVELGIFLIIFFTFCRQSSDPRSGFATVERDFAGGLTPMLGDKKVRQNKFLFVFVETRDIGFL